MARKSRTERIADIKALHSSLERYYQNMRTQMLAEDRVHNLIFGEDVVKASLGVRVHIPSTAPSIVRVVRDQIHVDSAQATVDSLGDSAKAMVRQDKLQVFHQSNLRHLMTGGRSNVLRQAVFDGALRGAMVGKVIYDEEAWPELPDHEEGEGEDEYKERVAEVRTARALSRPYYARPIDPLAAFPDPGDRFPMDFCLEVQKRRVIDMKMHYPKWRDPLRGNVPIERQDDPMREVEWLEYWTKDQYVVLVDGDMVIDKPNPYGFVPYVFEYSGLGRDDVSGDPQYMARGVLHDVMGELKAEVALKTAWDVLWQLSTYPRLLTTENAQDVKKNWDLTAGGIIQVPDLSDARRPRWMEMPQMNPAMFTFLPMLEASINRATFSPALRGERQPGVDYGYMMALQIGQTRQLLDPLKEAVEKFAAKLLGLMASCQEHVVAHPTTVYVTDDEGEKNVTVAPKDIGGHYRVRVTLHNQDPKDNDRRVLTGLQPLRAGVLSRRKYMKDYLGIDDPAAEDVRIRADQVIDQLVRSGFFAELVAKTSTLEEQRATAAAAVQEFGTQLRQEPGRAGPVNPVGGINPAESPLMIRRLRRLELGAGPQLGSPREGVQ